MMKVLRNPWGVFSAVVLCLTGVGFAAASITGYGACAGSVTSTPLGGGLVALDLDVAGNITHLGKSTVRIHTVADFGGTAPAPVPPTTGVVRAANGDTVSFTLKWSVEEVSPGLFITVGPFTITGGTGRFRGATGGGDYRGLVNLNTGQVSSEIAGQLTR